MHDISPDAQDVQLDLYRRMSPEARLGIALSLTNTSRRLLMEGIRRRHPDYSEEQVRLAAIRVWLGPKEFKLAYPDAPEIAP